MEQEDRIYILVSTWGCYSDYMERVLYVTNDKQQALNEAKTNQNMMNVKCLAKSVTDGYSDDEIDVDTSIVLRSYPLNQPLCESTKAEREAYHIDEETLYKAKQVTGKVDDYTVECYLLKDMSKQ